MLGLLEGLMTTLNCVIHERPSLLRVVGCLPSGQDRRGTAYCAGRRRTSLEGGNRGMLPCGWHRGYRYGVCRREAGLNAAIWQALRTAMSCRCLAKAWYAGFVGGRRSRNRPHCSARQSPSRSAMADTEPMHSLAWKRYLGSCWPS
jgi:hypothetical protein